MTKKRVNSDSELVKGLFPCRSQDSGSGDRPTDHAAVNTHTNVKFAGDKPNS